MYHPVCSHLIRLPSTSIRSPLWTVRLALSEKKIGLELIRQKLTQHTSQLISSPKEVAWSRAQSVGRREEEKNSPLREQPLTLSYTIHKCEQQIFSALRINNVVLKVGIKEEIEKAFKKLEENLKEAAVNFELGKMGKNMAQPYMEIRKALEGMNDEFVQARQALRLSSRLVNIELDKMDFGLNALKSSIKVNEKRGDSIGSKRSHSQAGRDPMNESSLCQKVTGMQKELAKLAGEVKKMESKIKGYEELFEKKDSVAQSMLSAYRAQTELAPERMEAQLSKKNEEILRLKDELATCTQQLKKTQVRFSVQPVSRTFEDNPSMLEKVCLEASTFLGIMDKLRRAIIKKDEVGTEKYRVELEEHKKILAGLVINARSSKAQSRFDQQESVWSLQKQKREIEYQYEKQSEEIIRYQNSLLDYIEKIKGKDQEIEALQQELLGYREKLQSLQEEFGSLQISRPEYSVEAGEAQIRLAEIVQEATIAFTNGYDTVKVECEDRLGMLMETVYRIQEKVSKYSDMQRQSIMKVRMDSAEDQEVIRELKEFIETLKTEKKQVETERNRLKEEVRSLSLAQKKVKEHIQGVTESAEYEYGERLEGFAQALEEKMEQLEVVKGNFEAVLNLLGTQMNEQIDEIEQLKEENGSLKAEIEAQKENEITEDVTEALKEQIKELTLELEEKENVLQENKVALTKERQTLKNTEEKLYKTMEGFRKLLNNYAGIDNGSIEKVLATIMETISRTQDLAMDYEKVKESLKNSLHGMQSAFEKLVQEVADKEYAIDSANEGLQKSENAIKTLKAENLELESTNNAIKTQNQELSVKLEEANKDCTEYKEKLQQLQYELAAAQHLKDEAETVSQAQFDQELSQLKDTLAEATKEKDAKDKEIALHKSTIAGLEAAKDQLTSKNEELSRAIEEANKSCEKYKERADQLEAELTLLKQSKDEAVLEVQSQLSQQITLLQEEKEAIKSSLDEEKDHVQTLLQENEKLKADLANKDLVVNQKIAELSQLKLYIKENLEKSKTVLAGLREELNDTKQALSSEIEQQKETLSNFQEDMLMRIQEKEYEISELRESLEHISHNENIDKERLLHNAAVLSTVKGELAAIKALQKNYGVELASDIASVKAAVWEGVQVSVANVQDKAQYQNSLEDALVQIDELKGKLLEGHQWSLEGLKGAKVALEEIWDSQRVFNEMMAKVKDEMEKFKRKHLDLQKKYEAVSEEREQLVLENEKLQKKHDSLEAAIHAKDKEIQKVLADSKKDKSIELLKDSLNLLSQTKATFGEIADSYAQLEGIVPDVTKKLLSKIASSKVEREEKPVEEFRLPPKPAEPSQEEMALEEVEVNKKRIAELEEENKKLQEQLEWEKQEHEIEMEAIKNDFDEKTTALQEELVLANNKEAEINQKSEEIVALKEKEIAELENIHKKDSAIKDKCMTLLERTKEIITHVKGNSKAIIDCHNNSFASIMSDVKNRIEAEILNIQERHSQLRTEKEKELADLKASLTVNSTELAKEKAELQIKCDELNKEIEDNEKKVSKLEKEKSDLNENIEWLKQEHEIELETTKSEYEEKVNTLQQKYDTVSDNNLKLKEECENYNKRVLQLLQEKGKYNMLLQEVLKVMAESKQSCKDVMCTYQVFADILPTVCNAMKTLQERVAVAKADKNTLEKSLVVKNEEIDKLANEKAEIESQCKAIKEEADMRQAELDKENKSLQEKVEWEQQQHEIDMEAVKNDFDEKTAEYEKEKAELQKKCSALQDLDDIKEAVQNTIQNFASENLKACMAKLAKYENALHIVVSEKLPDLKAKITSTNATLEKNKNVIHNYQIMLKDEQENTEKYAQNLQQSTNKCKKMEEERAEVRSLLLSALERIGENIPEGDELIPLIKHFSNVLVNIWEGRADESKKCREDLISLLKAYGTYEGTEDLDGVCEKIKFAFEKYTERLTILEKKNQSAHAAINKLKILANIDPLKPVLERLDFFNNKLATIGSSKEKLQEYISYLQIEIESNNETVVELRQALADSKEDINLLAKREEDWMAEKVALEEKLKESQETLDQAAKSVGEATEELYKALEGYGVSLREDQRSSLEILIKYTIDLMTTLAENDNKNEEEEQVKTPEGEKLELDDDDFVVGLVEDMTPQEDNKEPPATPGFPLSERDTAKDAEEAAKEPENLAWQTEREKLQNRIAELERNIEISEASDVRWHAEYEEIKNRIKLLAQKWGEEDAEGTIDEVERALERMNEEIENMRKEAGGDTISQKKILLEKDAKITELGNELNQIKESLKENQMNIDEKQKAVFLFYVTEKIQMEELTNHYLAKLEKISAERAELQQTMDDVKEEYMEVLYALPAVQ
eukprot:TRINITY_DN1033_c0_g1_i1.p1 TRINITY_DN1033_c0_g1~~TRINITY_DN1033_c0_g1_i1.p1  ORF type:complete len:2343 (-),score=535.53 TRINITY_DN1033_c0_g1_i1:240-7268(-)